MMLNGHVISKGIAYGKAEYLSCIEKTFQNRDEGIDEISKFDSAINKVKIDLEKKINKIEQKKDNRIADIFLSHKHIVTDPIVINTTKETINKGETALEAYTSAIEDVLAKFKKIDNQYMLGRIVDIIDASDKVKNELQNKELLYKLEFDEPTIIILENIKPSIIYSLENKNITGFISKEGYFNQHSGIIARSINIPGIVISDINKYINKNDNLVLDCFKGTVTVESASEVIDGLMEECK